MEGEGMTAGACILYAEKGRGFSHRQFARREMPPLVGVPFSR